MTTFSSFSLWTVALTQTHFGLAPFELSAHHRLMGIGQTITSSVFAYCHYQNPTPAGGADSVQNPGVNPTAGHESGHAYDFAIASLSNILMGPRNLYPSSSSGFKKLANADLAHLTSETVCGSFDGTTPSQLETQLGAVHPTKVCNGSTILAPYTGQSVKTILQEETPYFTNPGASLQYFDLWAETWAVAGPNNSSILPFMDYTIASSDLYSCVGTVMFSLMNYGKLPNAIGQGYPSYCPVVTDAQITSNVP